MTIRDKGRRPARRRPAQAGFTLIEIMVVVIIIGLLASIVGVAVFNQLREGRQNAARAQIKTFQSALDMYRLDCHHYPGAEEGLKALIEEPASGRKCRRYKKDGYLAGNRIPLDPWDNDYVYMAPGPQDEPYWIASYGADQLAGGEGEDMDITSSDVYGSELDE